jgi:hypothetical protein
MSSPIHDIEMEKKIKITGERIKLINSTEGKGNS